MDNKVVLAGLLIVTIAVAGCTGSSGGYSSGGTGTGDTAGGQNTDAGTGGSGSGSGTSAVKVVSASPDTTVAMKSTQFQSSPTVQPGTVIKFVNKDAYAHTVTIEQYGIDKRVAGGESVTLKFNKAATYSVDCTLHGPMKTSVTVEG